MTVTNDEINNAVRHTSKPGMKLLAFALVFLVTGIFTIIKFDSYFTDFWKIADCRANGPSQDYYMTDCHIIKVDRYDSGAIYMGIEKDAVARLKNVDVIIFGNSRTARSFATDAIKEYFDDKGLTYFSLAVEGSSFRAAVLMVEKLEVNPKIILVNNEIFYSDKLGDAFLEITNFPEKYETRFKFFRAAKSFQERICKSKIESLKKRYCTGSSPTYWRSVKTGLLDWNLIAEPKDQVAVNYTPSARVTQFGNFIGNASEMLDHPKLKNTCPVLYIVNSPAAAPQLLDNMADYLGVQSAFVHVDDIYTYDNSHLDRPNSEKWAKEFVKVMAPTIDNCLAGHKRKGPESIDLSPNRTKGKTDFETWRALANAAVTDKGVLAPDGTQSADLIKVPKPGAGVQNIYRSQEIKKGSTVTFTTWLWSNNFTNARIQIIRSCSAKSPLETSRATVSLTPRPQRFEISKTFEHDHKCALVKIIGLKEETDIYAWQGNFEYNALPLP